MGISLERPIFWAEFSLDAEHMKAVVLLFAIVGIAPSVLLSLWIVYVSCFVAPRHSPQLHPQRISLTGRIHFVQWLQGKQSQFDTVLWIPVLVVVLGIGFVILVGLFLYAHLA